MLTVQTCLRLLLTVGAIQPMPWVAGAIGWRHAFAVLAVGPLVGVVAMAALRVHPDALRMAGGRR
jgi:hypothetical protein